MMKKTQLLILFAFVIFGIIVSPFSLKAEEIENSFPVDNAGITAYAKINVSGIKTVTKALPFLDFVDDSGTTYALGIKEIPINIDNVPGLGIRGKNISVSFYIDTNGWIAAFLEKNEEASKIMLWTTYEKGEIRNNVLEETLSLMIKDLEVNLETPISYYHFGYPEANRIAMIVETMSLLVEKNNSFSMVVPGIIHEASYSFFYSFLDSNYYYPSCTAKLELDENIILPCYSERCVGADLIYENYDLGLMTSKTPHLIRISIDSAYSYNVSTGASTVIIYQV